MKGILINNRRCLLLFIVLIVCSLLIGCNGINSTFHFINATAGENGLIEPEGAIMISEGGSQTFIITPDEGYQIANVLVDGISVGSVSTYTFENIWQNHTIYAGFIAPGSRVTNTTTGVIYNTIQAAIDTAEDGQNIVASPWIYLENLVFDNKNITVQSTDPLNPAIVADTIIDGGGNNSVVQFIGGDTSTLYGFTIRNGYRYQSNGGGIYVIGSSPNIICNIITGNETEHERGGGIYVGNGSPTITGNTISNNKSGKFGGGIYVASGSPTINENTITENESEADGGGIYAKGNTTILGNTVTSNKVKETNAKGGGIHIYSGSFTITNNTFTDNKGGLGGGLHVDDCSATDINSNTFSGNKANYGGGLYVYMNDSLALTDNIFTGNIATYYGGGILVSLYSNLLPVTDRPSGWGTSRENIPVYTPSIHPVEDIPIGVELVPAEGETYTIAGNEFLGNKHGTPLGYTEGAHVYFQ